MTVTIPILKRSPQFGTDASKPTSGCGTKKKTVTMVIPQGVFGGRGKTEFKKTPSQVKHTGINLKKRGKQSSITIQRKCAWYNAQLEAEKRGINLENPPEEWQKFFDMIKKQLEKPNDGEGLVHEDGRLIWSIPSIPGGCVEDKENLAKQNVAEKVRFQKVESRKWQNAAAERRLLSNLTPVQSRWVKRRSSGVTRGLLAVLSARQKTDDKEKPSSKPAIAAGPPPIVFDSPPIHRVSAEQQQHMGTTETTPCYPRTKKFMLKGCSSTPRTLFKEKSHASGGKKIKRRRSMSARAQRIMSMSKRADITKRPEVRSPLWQLLKRESCNEITITNFPPISSKPDLVSLRKNMTICYESKQKPTDFCEGKIIISRNPTPISQEGLTTSPGHPDSEVVLRSEDSPTRMVSSSCSYSRKLEVLDKAKNLSSPGNSKALSHSNAAVKNDRVGVAFPENGNAKKIPNSSLVQFAEQKLETSLQPLSMQQSSNKENESTLPQINAKSHLFTTPLQSPKASCRLIPILERSSVCESPEKSKRKKLDQQNWSIRKKRKLEHDSHIISTDGLRSTKSPEIALTSSPSEKKRTLKNTVVLQTPVTPNISKPIKKKLSPGFVISKSEKRKSSKNGQLLRSSKRIRSQKRLTNKKKEPYTFSMEDTLVTPQRSVLQANEESKFSKAVPGGGELLIPSSGTAHPHSIVKDAKAKVHKRKKLNSPWGKIRTRTKQKQRNVRRKTPRKKKPIRRKSLGFHKSNSTVVHSVQKQMKSDEVTFPLSFDVLKKQFKLVERDMAQMATLHKKRLSAVFSKLEKIETMVEVLGQHTKGAPYSQPECLQGNAGS